jgi:hypothetical protein
MKNIKVKPGFFLLMIIGLGTWLLSAKITAGESTFTVESTDNQTIPIVLGALAGGFLIFLYERWAVKQGFQAWIIPAGNAGEVITPSWRKLWWWILISFQILLVGLIAGVMLLKMFAG